MAESMRPHYSPVVVGGPGSPFRGDEISDSFNFRQAMNNLNRPTPQPSSPRQRIFRPTVSSSNSSRSPRNAPSSHLRPPHPMNPQFQQPQEHHQDHYAHTNTKLFESHHENSHYQQPQPQKLHQDHHELANMKSFEDRVNQALQRNASHPVHPHIHEMQTRQNHANDTPSVVHGRHMNHYVNETITNDIVYEEDDDICEDEFVKVFPNNKGCVHSIVDDVGYLFGCGPSPEDEVVVIFNGRNNPNQEEKRIHNMLLQNEDPQTSPRARHQPRDSRNPQTSNYSRAAEYEFLRDQPYKNSEYGHVDGDNEMRSSCMSNSVDRIVDAFVCGSTQKKKQASGRGFGKYDHGNQYESSIGRKDIGAEVDELKDQLKTMMQERLQKQASPPSPPKEDKVSKEVDRLRQEQQAMAQAMQQLQQQQFQMTIQAAALAQQQMQHHNMAVMSPSNTAMMSPNNMSMMSPHGMPQQQIQNAYNMGAMSPSATSHTMPQHQDDMSRPLSDCTLPPTSPMNKSLLGYFSCNSINKKGENKDKSNILNFKNSNFMPKSSNSNLMQTSHHHDGQGEGCPKISNNMLSDLRAKTATMRQELEKMRQDMDEQLRSEGTWVSTEIPGGVNVASGMRVGTGTVGGYPTLSRRTNPSSIYR